MMKTLKVLCFVLMASVLMPSCMTTRTNVKNFKESQGQVYRYAKGKQCYLFWGLIPLGRTTVATPVDQPCQVRTVFGFWDSLLTTITGGIFSMQTIKVMAKRTPEPGDKDYFNVGDEVTYKVGKEYQKGIVDTIIDGEYCIVKTADNKLKKMKFENLSK